MKILDDPNINWDAISALSNFAVAIVTLITVFITLYFSWNNVRTKYKTVLNRIGNIQKYGGFYRISLINKGFVPLTILDKGILVHKFRWKKRGKQIIHHVNLKGGFKLDIGERDNIIIEGTILNKKLLELDYNPGDNVPLVAFFIDPSNKIYSKRFNVTVFAEQQQPEVRLNMDRLQNTSTE
ncbi:hypothetical protein ACPA1T_06475 [Bacillus amyloliquefaciens]|uniref:hypothetical protein n=1 Tax=Bacillus amyloliquefaciens TaxID=1390 RepID=UPI003C752440